MHRKINTKWLATRKKSFIDIGKYRGESRSHTISRVYVKHPELISLASQEANARLHHVETEAKEHEENQAKDQYSSRLGKRHFDVGKSRFSTSPLRKK